MRTRILLCAGIVLCLAGVLQAVTTQWAPAPGKNLWSDPTNWSAGLPTENDKAQFLQQAECIVDFDGAVTGQLHGDGGPIKIVDGGVLTTHDWLILGYNGSDVGELEVHDGGVLNALVRVFLGHKDTATGILTVKHGGTVNILSQQLAIGGTQTGTGILNLDGGVVKVTNLDMSGDGKGTIDVSGGTLIIDGDRVDYIQGIIDAGDPNYTITGYGGAGTLNLDYNVTNPGKTTLSATHYLKPFPADGSIAPPGDVELSWTPPDPCVPGTTVKVDVWFADDVDKIYYADPEAKLISEGDANSLQVTAVTKTRYYWAVDTYVGSPEDPILGPIFSFLADNAPPKVSAGLDVSTFLKDGVRTGPLNGAVTDDGAIQPYTVLWTVVEEPNEPNLPDAVIADPTAEQTTVTLYAEGTYVLQLEAYDGEYTTSDSMTITVHPDDWAVKEE